MSITEFAQNITISAGGTGTITIKTQGRQTWELQQVSVEVDPLPAAAQCTLRKNGAIVTPIVLTGTGGAAGGYPPLILRPPDSCTVVFTGCTSGQIVKVTGIYDDGAQ